MWKRTLPLLLWILAACGDDKAVDPVRVVAAGTLFQGLAGGETRAFFADGTSLAQPVTGTAAIHVPRGVFSNTAFPLTATFSVLDGNNRVIEASVDFPSVRRGAGSLYTGSFAEADVEAALTFQLQNTTAGPVIDLQSLAYSAPATGAIVRRRTVVAGQLRQQGVQLLP